MSMVIGLPMRTRNCCNTSGARFASALTKSAEKPRRSGRGWIGVGRAGLNAQEPNKTHAVPEPSRGEGTAEVEAPAFMPGRTSTGDAGIGKSRLVQVLKEHVANEPHTRWECRSAEYSQNTALFPL